MNFNQTTPHIPTQSPTPGFRVSYALVPVALSALLVCVLVGVSSNQSTAAVRGFTFVSPVSSGRVLEEEVEVSCSLGEPSGSRCRV